MWAAESLPPGSVSDVLRGLTLLALPPTGLSFLGFSRGLRKGSPLSSSSQHRGKEMRAMKLNECKQRILLGRKAAPAGAQSCDLGDVSQRQYLKNLGRSCSKPATISQPL